MIILIQIWDTTEVSFFVVVLNNKIKMTELSVITVLSL